MYYTIYEWSFRFDAVKPNEKKKDAPKRYTFSYFDWLSEIMPCQLLSGHIFVSKLTTVVSKRDWSNNEV